jgi:hypothetical protein
MHDPIFLFNPTKALLLAWDLKINKIGLVFVVFNKSGSVRFGFKNWLVLMKIEPS